MLSCEARGKILSFNGWHWLEYDSDSASELLESLSYSENKEHLDSEEALIGLLLHSQQQGLGELYRGTTRVHAARMEDTDGSPVTASTRFSVGTNIFDFVTLKAIFK